MQTQLALICVLLFATSGLFLKHIFKFNVSRANCIIPIIFSALGLLAATQLRDFSEAVIFFLATVGQFMAYVFVSRLRQRGSFFWHAVASVGSNGMWFVTLHILSGANAYWLLFIPYVIGIVTGRIAGVNWAQFIEQRYKLQADATRDPKLEPGKRLNYVMKEPIFWVLVIGLVGYIVYGYSVLSTIMYQAILIVIGLGVLQNFFYALVTRASQRGNNWYIASAGILAGLSFYFSAIFLLSMDMTFVLIVPYILATTLGSTIGAFCSMILERIMKLRPDTHLENIKKERSVWKERFPYAIILSLAVFWIFSHEALFAIIGYTPNQLKFPISSVTADLPRILVMVSAAIVFMLDSALHTLTSRAGNRNHTGYHIATLVPKGFSDFLKISYLSLNSNVPDIIPVAILASCLGSLFGKDVSQTIERWLQAKMDVEPEKPKSQPVDT